jgi:hypothetical protein
VYRPSASEPNWVAGPPYPVSVTTVEPLTVPTVAVKSVDGGAKVQRRAAEK